MKPARILFGVLLASILWTIQTARSETMEPSQVFHEDLGQALDNLARGIHDWSARWWEHFTYAEPTGERPLISLMLRYQDELGLTAEQVKSLKQLRADYERESIRKGADLRIAQRDLEALLDADTVDLRQVESKIRELERLRADLRFARIRTLEKGKAELSPEQLAKFRTLIGEPHHARRLPRFQ